MATAKEQRAEERRRKKSSSVLADASALLHLPSHPLCSSSGAPRTTYLLCSSSPASALLLLRRGGPHLLLRWPVVGGAAACICLTAVVAGSCGAARTPAELLRHPRTLDVTTLASSGICARPCPFDLAGVHGGYRGVCACCQPHAPSSSCVKPRSREAPSSEWCPRSREARRIVLAMLAHLCARRARSRAEQSFFTSGRATANKSLSASR